MLSSDVKRPRRGVSPGADPSRVLFVRDIQSNTSEYELQRAFEVYGRVSQVFLMPQRHQALVEFETLLEAEDLIRRQSEGESILVRDVPVQLSYSKQAQITDPKKEYLSRGPSHLLLFTLFNVRVEVDCETFKKICSPYGRLERVTISKSMMDAQVIVEFSSIEEASRAKPQLNGADIYANCNTLRCEYVTPDVFNHLLRDSRSLVDEWLSGRQTTPAVAKPASHAADRRRVAIFDGPLPPTATPVAPATGPQRGVVGGGGANSTTAAAAMVSSLLGLATQLTALNVPGFDAQGIIERLAPLTGLLPDQQHSQQQQLSQQQHLGAAAGVIPTVGPAGNQHSSTILFLSGLSERLNCDRLFNVLCLYGNVRRIKFFASTKGQAMAEMLDARSADTCVHFLHNIQLLGKRLIVDYSRQRLLKDVKDAVPLPDGTPSVKDYETSGRNCRNRFLSPEMAKKNNPIDPSAVVYFWGSQPEATEQDILGLLESVQAPLPDRMEFLNSENKSGFLFFNNPRDSLDAICLANHSELQLGERSWLIRMSFSLSKDGRAGHNNGQRGTKRQLQVGGVEEMSG